jgi:hypothetical protein
MNGPATTIRWGRGVLTADDLRRSLNGHRDLLLAAHTVVTPLAADELRHGDVTVRREEATSTGGLAWAVLSDRSYAFVRAAVATLVREGLAIREENADDMSPKYIARSVTTESVIFTPDTALVVCAANKVPGVRAVSVSSVGQMARALQTVAPNVVAVEMPGRTFFEIRQVIRLCVQGGHRDCPTELADVLKSLEKQGGCACASRK